MLQRLKNIGLIGLILAGSTVGASAAELSGPFSGEFIGNLNFTTEGSKVVGRHVQGGACPYEPETTVIEGELQGTVLVGQIHLCQRGTGCKSRTYPVLAIFDPSDGSLSAHLKLESGCDSPGLRDRQLSLQPSSAPAEGDETAQAAAVVARRKPLTKEEVARARRAFRSAETALVNGDFDASVTQWKKGLELQEDNWGAYVGLGVAELKRGRAPEALRAFKRARDLKPDEPDIYYNLACAYARMKDRRGALDNLQKAVDHGFNRPDGMARDEDLTPLLRNDLEFQKLIQKAWTLQNNGRKQRKR